MDILKIVGIVIGTIIGLIVLILVLIKLLVYKADKGAEKTAKRYCEERSYKFKKVEAYPNHYGLFLKKDNMHIYASFHYEANGSLTWIKGSPEEKINARLEKKKSN